MEYRVMTNGKDWRVEVKRWWFPVWTLAQGGFSSGDEARKWLREQIWTHESIG